MSLGDSKYIIRYENSGATMLTYAQAITLIQDFKRAKQCTMMSVEDELLSQANELTVFLLRCIQNGDLTAVALLSIDIRHTLSGISSDRLITQLVVYITITIFWFKDVALGIFDPSSVVVDTVVEFLVAIAVGQSITSSAVRPIDVAFGTSHGGIVVITEVRVVSFELSTAAADFIILGHAKELVLRFSMIHVVKRRGLRGLTTHSWLVFTGQDSQVRITSSQILLFLAGKLLR